MPPNPQPNHLQHPECRPSLSLTYATSVPEHCPPSTNKRPCHVSTGAPSTTTEAREEVNGEARKEACREYKRHARRQGDREGGGIWPLSFISLPPSAAHCMNKAVCGMHAALFSLVIPSCPLYYYYLLYITCIIRNQYNPLFFLHIIPIVTL